MDTSIEIKIKKKEQEKKLMFDIINVNQTLLQETLKKTESLTKNYNYIINFVDITRVFQLYLLKSVRLEYKLCKKNSGICNRNINTIIKKHDNVNTCMTADEISKFDDSIKGMRENYVLLVFNISLIANLNKDVQNKYKSIVKKQNHVILKSMNDKIKPSFDNLCNIYNSIRDKKKELQMLRSKRLLIKSEISNLEQQLIQYAKK